MIRPYLLIDVDGVLNPFGSGVRPEGFSRHQLMGNEVWLSRRHGLWLNQLATWFDLVWTTAWEHDAPRLIAPILKLPTDLPVIEFGQGAADETWKLHDVERFVGNRPLAWIDDELWGDAFAWADRRDAPTLLIRISSSVGTYRTGGMAVGGLRARGRGPGRLVTDHPISCHNEGITQCLFVSFLKERGLSSGVCGLGFAFLWFLSAEHD
jgi:hypothetical protein